MRCRREGGSRGELFFVCFGLEAAVWGGLMSENRFSSKLGVSVIKGLSVVRQVNAFGGRSTWCSRQTSSLVQAVTM